MKNITSQCFTFERTPLEGLWFVERNSLTDSRGFFSRFWCDEEFKLAGWQKPVAQINHTLTCKRGAVRGMHFQFSPYDEMKLVTCIRGKVFDVAVDLRAGSPTFLQYYAIELSSENRNSLVIPEGFAHGFQTMAEDCEMMYLHTNYFDKGSEGALNVNDPRLGISWPLDISEISERDSMHPMISEDFEGIVL